MHQHRSGGTPVGGSRLPQRGSGSAAEGTPEKRVPKPWRVPYRQGGKREIQSDFSRRHGRMIAAPCYRRLLMASVSTFSATRVGIEMHQPQFVERFDRRPSVV